MRYWSKADPGDAVMGGGRGAEAVDGQVDRLTDQEIWATSVAIATLAIGAY